MGGIIEWLIDDGIGRVQGDEERGGGELGMRGVSILPCQSLAVRCVVPVRMGVGTAFVDWQIKCVAGELWKIQQVADR